MCMIESTLGFFYQTFSDHASWHGMCLVDVLVSDRVGRCRGAKSGTNEKQYRLHKSEATALQEKS